MAKKLERAFFTAPNMRGLREAHYGSVAEAAKALGTTEKVLTRIEKGESFAKSTLLKLLRTYRAKHDPKLSLDEQVVDKRAAAAA